MKSWCINLISNKRFSKLEGEKHMRKRTNKIMILGLVFVMAVGMMACGKGGKMDKILSLGAENLMSGDYLAAIDTYREAINFDKYELSAYIGLISALVGDQRDSEEIIDVVEEATDAMVELKESNKGMTDDQKASTESFYTFAAGVFAGDYEDEVAVLEKGVEVVGEESTLAETYEEKVKEAIDYYLSGNNLEEAKGFADQLVATVPSKSENVELAEEVEEKAESEQGLVDILMIAYDQILLSDWQALADFSESEEIEALKEKIGDVGNYTYIFGGGTTGMGIGYYSMEGCTCDEWYVGEYVDGNRCGEGGWYWAVNNTDGLYLETYYGAWAEDMPNGDGHRYVERCGEVLLNENVTLKNGLYNGTFTVNATASDGYEYTLTYEVVDGRYVEIEVKDWLKEYVQDGMYPYAVAYRELEDGRETAYWRSTSYDGNLASIAHFGE